MSHTVAEVCILILEELQLLLIFYEVKYNIRYE